MKKPVKILTCGNMMIDMTVNIDPKNPADIDLMGQHQFQSGGKRTIKEEEFTHLKETYEGRDVHISPGGSVYNTAVTLKGVMGKNADITFLGMAGNGPHAELAKSRLQEAGIGLKPEHVSDPEAHCGMSYCLDPQGKAHPDTGIELSRSYACYSGNAKDKFTPEAVPDLEHIVKDSDIVMVGASVLERMNHDMAHALLTHRWNHGKDLVISLPVDPQSASRYADYFQWVIPSANVVLANDEELKHTYNADNSKDALLRLQQEFQKHQLTQEAGKAPHERPWRGNKHQVGFITAGKEGAYLVTADEIKHIECLPTKAGETLYTAGAGDTAFAGFLLGYVNGCSDEVSALIGMQLANEKLLHKGSRVPNPEEALRCRMPKVATQLFGPPETRFRGATDNWQLAS